MSGSNNAPNNCNGTSFFSQLDCGAGSAADNSGESVGALAAAIVGSLGSAGAQLLIFIVLRIRLSRIYRPRSYLVPERERVPAPPSGIVAWLVPLFTTPNLAFIQKCGLDAYFFLRYLQMLLKIFLPMALVLLPILLPINRYSGNAKTGLDKLSIANVAGQYIATRYWAHLILALCVITWVCYVLYRELRGYIRVRQAFLTSPQHRIRASSTTVLVTGIPHKWLTLEALNGLYDVFPGGIRNIWINRNFDELATKVSYRNSLAKSLESAETNLIRNCWSKHQKAEEKAKKKAGKRTKDEKLREAADADAAAEQMAQSGGISAGDQHDTPRDLQEALQGAEQHEEQRSGYENALGFVGDGFGAVGKGLGRFGRGVGNFGQKMVDDVDTGIHKAAGGVSHGVDQANAGGGFIVDDSLYASPDLSYGVPPTPPPKSPHFERIARLQRERDAQRKDEKAAERGIATVAESEPVPRISIRGSPDSQATRVFHETRFTGPSLESSKPPQSSFEIEEPPQLTESKTSIWRRWHNQDTSLALPSPQPHTAEEDEFPLNATAVRTISSNGSKKSTGAMESGASWINTLMFWKGKKGEEKPEDEYPEGFNKDWDEDQDGEPRWRQYLEPKDRETMRVPVFSPTWCPSLPLIGRKVDRIYYTRRELARLNMEIEADQSNIEKFPFMNSAFIQFNHQIAAHMACQSVSHHVPQAMAPRIVEISPEDVIWSNMSIRWWERYVRAFLVLVFCVALIIFYAIPVSFTSLLAKIDDLAQRFPWLHWLTTLPGWFISAIEGLLPPTILSVILSLVPVIFRLLVKQQGVPTGNQRELYVQQWYFAFLFIQVFLVVTITGGLTQFFSQVSANPTSVVNLLAQDLPSGADYFFSYLLVQALSNSASALLQVGSLVTWFLLAPILDSTARAKWRRQTSLSNIQWGSFFPEFTNFAVIGLIYSVIAPLILFFMIIIFGVFWVVYRYNVLYVYQFRNDTGGLLFPTAISQLFTGLYLLELFLIGLFFTRKNQNNNVVCIPQGVIMIVALVGTIGFQVLLSTAFSPLLRYLPITLEDEAVIRDEEFARAQASKFQPLARESDGPPFETNDHEESDVQEFGNEYEGARRRTGDGEKTDQRLRQSSHQSLNPDHLGVDSAGVRRASAVTTSSQSPRIPWHQREQLGNSPRSTWKTDRWRKTPEQAVRKVRDMTHIDRRPTVHGQTSTKGAQDIEAQRTVGDVLFSGFADELEDLTPDERDLLVRYAFQHSALRAKRPVVWIPRDRLGVSDDEIRRAKRMSTVLIPGGGEGEEEGEEKRVEKTNIWMSNDGTALDGKGKVVFRRSPPDFSNVDLIAL